MKLPKVLLSSLAALPFTALASTSPFAGFYLHGQLGASQFSNTYNYSHHIASPGVESLNAQTSTPSNTNNLTGLVGFGYASVWRNLFYWGWQADLIDSSAVTSTQSMSNQGGVSSLVTENGKLNDIAFAIKTEPGFVLHTDALIYAELGWQITNGSMPLSSEDSGTNANTTANPHRTLNAVVTGFGMKQFLTPHMAMEMTYEHVGYGNIHAEQNGDLNSTSLNYLNTRQKFELNNYLLGLDYYFNHANAGSADTLFSDPKAFSGIYLGVGVGTYQPSVETHDEYTAALPIFTVNRTNEASLGRLSAGFNAFAGYAFNLSRFNFGIDAFFNENLKHNLNATGQAGNDTASVLVNNNTHVNLDNCVYGVEFRPGIIINNNALFYLHVGAAFNQAELSQTIQATSNVAPVNNSITTSRRKTLTGVEAGLGLQEKFASHTALDMEYTYSYYGSISAPQASRTDATTTLSIGNNAAKISTQAVSLGIVQYFSV